MTRCLPLWSLVFQKEIWRGFEKTQFVSLSWKITMHKHKSMKRFKTGFSFESRNFSLQKKRCRRASRKLSRTPPWRYSHCYVIIIFMALLLQVISKFIKQWTRKCCSYIKYQILSILRPSRASTSGLDHYPGCGESSPRSSRLWSLWKPEADDHLDQGHDAHRPQGQPQTELDEAR